ncbi:hypothetical protein PFISCL1PPCAC_960, partial [Pristionchus fissidentatus]
IRWEVDNVSKLTSELRYSPLTFIADLPWSVAVRRRSWLGKPFFSCNIYCNDESDCYKWRVHHKSTVVLINRENPAMNVLGEMKSMVFKKGAHGAGHQLIPFEYLLEEKYGFIKDDKIIVEGRITITNIEGVPPALKYNFDEPCPGWENIVLNIEGKKINVRKQYLSDRSPYFAALFNGDFVERNQKEIEMKEVSYEEFIELLLVVYPSLQPITFDSYRFVLALADRFMIKFATSVAELYLIKTKKLSTSAKLLLADQYRLEVLKRQCLNSFEFPSDIKALENTVEFSQYSSDMNSSLFKRILELMR